MRTTFTTLLMSLSLLFAGNTEASTEFIAPPIQIEKYSAEQGLYEEFVTDIVVDKHGFVWTGTRNSGVDRFDGDRFFNFKHDPDDANSLPSNFVKQLLLDKEQRIWIVTNGGLARFDEEHEHFVVFNSSNSILKSDHIYALTTTESGDIVIADDQSVYLYNHQGDTFEPYEFGLDSTPVDTKTLLDTQNTLWIGTLSGELYRFDKQSKHLDTILLSNGTGDIPPVISIFTLELIDGEIWVGTDSGLFILSEDGSVGAEKNPASQPAFKQRNVRSVLKTSDDEVWIGHANGLTVLNTKTLDATEFNASYFETQGVSTPAISKLAMGSEQTIWIGTIIDGLLKYHPSFSAVSSFTQIEQSHFEDTANTFWSIEEDGSGQIWVATQNFGIATFSVLNNQLINYPLDNTGLVWDLDIDSRDRFFLSTSNGLFVFQKDDNKLIEIAHFFEGVDIPYAKIIGDRVWLSSPDGDLSWIDLNDLSMNSLVMPYEGIQYAFPVFKDERERLWITSDIGNVVLDLATEKFRQVSLSKEQSFIQLIDGTETPSHYWFTTFSNGLIAVEKQSLKIEHVLGPSSTPSFTSAVSMANLNGQLWLATNDGTFVVNTDTAEVTEHLPRALFNYETFIESSVHIVDNSLLLVGGRRGLHVVNPSQFLSLEGEKTKTPQLTELGIFNTPLSDYGSDLTLDKPIYLKDAIDLKSEDSPFFIGFGLINATGKNSTRYRYRMRGSDKGWLLTDIGQRRATYTNLSHGNYTFEVQAKQSKGQWSDSRTLDIVIHPPFWLSNNAIAIYAIVASLVAVGLVQQYRNRKRVLKQVADSEETLKLTLWSSGDELWDWQIHSGILNRSNTWGTLSFPQDNHRASEEESSNIHPSDKARVAEALQEHLAGQSEYFDETYRIKTFRDEWIWINDRGKVVEWGEDGNPLRMTGTLKDINHLKTSEEQLRLFKRSIETISDGVFIANRQFRFINVNQAYCKYTGQTRDQALATYLQFNQYPEPFTEEVKKTLLQKRNWSGEVESARTNGERFEIDLNIDAIQDEDGNISHFVGVFSDITTRKTTEKELLKLANTDPLTELPNRSFFQASHQNLVRKNTSHTLLCLDMDNFKKINDSMGHQVGDTFIKQIAKRLQKLTGSNATCYRLGGDEFAILVDKTTDVHRITHFAQFILDEMVRPFMFNKQELVLGASIGIAIFPMDGSTSQELLKNADTAMYFAKNAGGNKYQFFSGEMNQNAVRQLQIENLIRHGLKEDLFTVFYQPKIDIQSGKLVSMEALVRFEHPEKGVVSPSQFIPLAEETGQIIDIGEIVMRKACTDTQRWVAAGLFSGRVAINLSARQFEIPDLDDRLENILKQTGLSPLHLECEITEGTLMQQPEQSLVLMQRLREKGIHLALDDFGTGYSSLAYLKEFPLNTLKIDKAFIDGIATSNVDRQMISAIITIAHNLGLKVVAEGVEEEKQLQILKQYKCELLQGYLFSKPLSSDRFEKLLIENKKLNRFIRTPQG